MAILRCKMCGGTLEVFDNSTVTECEYCGTKQTIPTVDDEKKLNLFSRANRLRAACEFDKAATVYESIVADFPEEAEAYWGLVLCKFGIEYVDDPTTGKKIPTCHRSSFDSLMDDADFDMVMETSDPEARRVYRDEAKAIEEIRKGIVEVSNKEEPYDIFICYKETDDIGNRTVDSVLAQDIYDMLTENKYRVFFSRISLEDKLGVEYEPYIFAALNSAKIMLAIGTDYEYFNAVWVKNEWSRFLQLMAKDRKKALIPCYKNIDAYDIPREFSKLQAQDLGKIGAMQDLLRGIKKLLPKGEQTESGSGLHINGQSNSNANLVTPLLERAFIFLEEGNWTTADEYFERVLDLDPKNTRAYIGKLLIQAQLTNQDELLNSDIVISNLPYYKTFLKFGDKSLIEKIKEHDLLIQKEHDYQEARRLINNIGSFECVSQAKAILQKLGDYKDSLVLVSLIEEAEHEKETRTKAIDEKYNERKARLKQEKQSKIEEAKNGERKRDSINSEIYFLKNELASLGSFSFKKSQYQKKISEQESALENLPPNVDEVTKRYKKKSDELTRQQLRELEECIVEIHLNLTKRIEKLS